VEVVDDFPEECRHVLETLGRVYHRDGLAREQKLSPEERLRFHQQHSGALMRGLHAWLEAQLAEHKTEPNSGLGKAISYLLKHRPKPTLFLQASGSGAVWFCGAGNSARSRLSAGSGRLKGGPRPRLAAPQGKLPLYAPTGRANRQ